MILYSIRSETLSQRRDFRIERCVAILEPGQQFEQEHFGCLGDDIFDISEDYSTESYSSQAWSVRWRWQLFSQCKGQGSDGYSREHECDDSRI